MNVDLEKFTRELDLLIAHEPDAASNPAPALQIAAALLSLGFESEAAPSAGLRARWVSRATLLTKTESKSLMVTLRARPVLMMLIALLILLTLSGVVYAIGKSLGYIPGIGVIDQSAPLRVLAEPVSQTRDGITIAIKEAIISSDKTIITLVIKNIPSDKLSPITDATCPQWPELRLPDGTLLKLTGGEGNVLAPKYEMRLVYAPMPADINDVALLIHCIERAAPGALPENWELPLRFIPAPPDMTVMPVIEVTPVAEIGTVEKNPLIITKVIDTGDGYILTGEFQPTEELSQQIDSGGIGFRITDGSGQDVGFEGFPQDIEMPTPTSPTAEVWSVKFSKGFVPPIHITYTKQYILADPSQETIEFEFDAGENPQAVRTWQMDKEFTLAGHTFTLTSVVALPSNSYEFNFESTDRSIYSVNVVIDGYPPDVMGGGMDAGMVGASGAWGVPVGPYSQLPKGKLKVILSRLWLIGEIKDWTIDWQP